MLFIRSYDDLTSRRDVKPLPKHSAKNLSLLQPLDAPRRLTAELVARLTADITSGKLAPAFAIADRTGNDCRDRG